MIVLQGLIDMQTHGKFLGSFTNYIVGNPGAPTIPGPWYNCVLLLLGVMIPPFSLLFIGSVFHWRVIRNHIVLVVANDGVPDRAFDDRQQAGVVYYSHFPDSARARLCRSLLSYAERGLAQTLAQTSPRAMGMVCRDQSGTAIGVHSQLWASRHC